ncbi:cupin domain-containing protein [Streptomyces ficellus]|uniref:Cupin domain-containing protein n=1 Tax=Streptomyces ficellus TaxID=1977088 RepID=A0ABT7YZD4_9ACTN|nr:cupin domain-containing protein [Streptomyces ficellus]MDN3292608.1 cupin domain-containing protein [Streptomyces ficellus]
MSPMRVTRLQQAPPYQPPSHHGVGAVRLQGHEAGPTARFWTGLSYYLPGGAADAAPTAEETVYVVLDGEVVVTADGHEEALRPYDSVHLAKGQIRSVENRSKRPATLLVTIALPDGEG